MTPIDDIATVAELVRAGRLAEAGFRVMKLGGNLFGWVGPGWREGLDYAVVTDQHGETDDYEGRAMVGIYRTDGSFQTWLVEVASGRAEQLD